MVNEIFRNLAQVFDIYVGSPASVQDVAELGEKET